MGDAIKTAILIDGGYYRKRANHLFGEKSPEERAEEIVITHKVKIGG